MSVCCYKTYFLLYTNRVGCVFTWFGFMLYKYINWFTGWITEKYNKPSGALKYYVLCSLYSHCSFDVFTRRKQIDTDRKRENSTLASYFFILVHITQKDTFHSDKKYTRKSKKWKEEHDHIIMINRKSTRSFFLIFLSLSIWFSGYSLFFIRMVSDKYILGFLHYVFTRHTRYVHKTVVRALPKGILPERFQKKSETIVVTFFVLLLWNILFPK